MLTIVAHPTGVVYSHQCGGHSSLEQSLEGFLIPLGEPDLAQGIFDWFWREFRGHCYAPETDWTADRITKLRDLIAEIPCWHTGESREDSRSFLQLDTVRMRECVEAWIPILTPYGPGILILKNSD